VRGDDPAAQSGRVPLDWRSNLADRLWSNAVVSSGAGYDLEELETIAIELAEAAGRSVLERASLGARAVAYKSTPTDLVTDIDRAIEVELVQALRQRRPGDAVRGEEGGVHSESADGGGVEWVLDPIDGTVNFVLGIPWFSVSVAACVDGRSVAGCVADPNRGEIFHARLGGGSFLRTDTGSQRLSGPRDVPLAEAVMGTGFAYSAAVRVRQARVLAELIGRLGNVRRLGSAALDLCYVGAGRLDAYFEAGLADWDMAAGILVAAEAGARVGGLEASSVNDGLLAASPERFDELATALTELGAHRVFEDRER
jgi:myo-inositol-1(or 4)-monophosphatase